MNSAKQTINIAIIIPTLNEEHYIGRLLDSLIKQNIKPSELVIVDAYSKDKTIFEIRKRQRELPQLKIFKIPKYTVARQRNFGIKKTHSPDILFLDADMELRDENDLEKYYLEIKSKKPDLAVARSLPDSTFWKDTVYYELENLLIRLSKYVWPVILARNLYIKRKIFVEVGGFDEEITVGEDQDLVQRILKNGGKLIFLKSVKLYTSTRRVIRDGRIRHALRMLFFGINIIRKGHRKSQAHFYDFGNFNKPQNL